MLGIVSQSEVIRAIVSGVIVHVVWGPAAPWPGAGMDRPFLSVAVEVSASTP